MKKNENENALKVSSRVRASVYGRVTEDRSSLIPIPVLQNEQNLHLLVFLLNFTNVPLIRLNYYCIVYATALMGPTAIDIDKSHNWDEVRMINATIYFTIFLSLEIIFIFFVLIWSMIIDGVHAVCTGSRMGMFCDGSSSQCDADWQMTQSRTDLNITGHTLLVNYNIQKYSK